MALARHSWRLRSPYPISFFLAPISYFILLFLFVRAVTHSSFADGSGHVFIFGSLAIFCLSAKYASTPIFSLVYFAFRRKALIIDGNNLTWLGGISRIDVVIDLSEIEFYRRDRGMGGGDLLVLKGRGSNIIVHVDILEAGHNEIIASINNTRLSNGTVPLIVKYKDGQE